MLREAGVAVEDRRRVRRCEDDGEFRDGGGGGSILSGCGIGLDDVVGFEPREISSGFRIVNSTSSSSLLTPDPPKSKPKSENPWVSRVAAISANKTSPSDASWPLSEGSGASVEPALRADRSSWKAARGGTKSRKGEELP